MTLPTLLPLSQWGSWGSKHAATLESEMTMTYLKHIAHRDIPGDKRDVVALRDAAQHLLYLAWQADHSVFDDEVVEQETVRSVSMEGDTMEGDTAEGDTVEGDTMKGDTVEGDTMEGDTCSVRQYL